MIFQRLEIFLTTVIILFFLLTLIFLILLSISRFNKTRLAKKQVIYDSAISNFMFLVIFEDKYFEDLPIERKYKSIINSRFFKLCLLQTIIKLHKTYTGEFAKKIETFYYGSYLIDETYKKLESSKWPIKCEAIRELAEMNVTSSYSLINKYVNSKKPILRQEAIIAVTKLLGLKGLLFLTDYKEILSDWLQLNLISVLKNNFPVTDEHYYNSFITSPNDSIALFGKRVRSFYEQTGESFFEINNDV